MKEETHTSKDALKPPLHLTRETQSYTKYLARKVTGTAWWLKLLEISWTAGPVTFLGLQGGSLIGYGKAAGFNTFMYFAVYTMIMGVVAVIAHHIAQLHKSNKHQENEYTLTLVLSYLPDLIITASNKEDQHYEKEDRIIRVASRVLQNPNALPEALEFFVNLITNNTKLAKNIAIMEILRRGGMHQLIDDLCVQCNNVEDSIASLPQHVQQLIKQRICGKAPSLKKGLPRPEGFIERVLSAGENDDLALMTLSDAEHVFRLAFELLNDRSIPLVSFRYKGNRSLNEAAHRLEQARSQYRAAKARFRSILKIICRLLEQNKEVPLKKLPSLNTLEGCVTYALEGVKLLQHTADHIGSNNEALYKIQKLWPLLIQSRKHINEKAEHFIKARKRWKEISDTDHNLFVFTHSAKRGLYIFEQDIMLSDVKKLDVAKRITQNFENLSVLSSTHHLVIEEEVGTAPIGEDSLKHLAIEVLLALDGHLHLGRSSMQYAIESANAANLGGIEIGITTTTKLAWGKAAVVEVEKNMGKAAEQLAYVLVTHYGETLDDTSIQFFSEKYGADANRLKTFKKPITECYSSNEIIDHQNFPEIPGFPE